ncbi:MAG: indole-3-glycerol-phosphate synthase [Fervidicoccaceae archaeon]
MSFVDSMRILALRRIEALSSSADAPSIVEALERRRSEGFLALIAEYKRVSPSGVIRLDLDPWTYFEKVSRYATALSVVAEPLRFAGHPLFVKVAVSFGRPVLYKDFVVSPRQLEEARGLGASSALLIKRLLGDHLWELVDEARRLGLEPLIEVDNEDDAREVAREAPDSLLGVNSRDLRDLSVSLERAKKAVEAVRGRVRLVVLESGIASRRDAEAAASWGADAILVGTSLMRSPELAAELSSVKVSSSPNA